MWNINKSISLVFYYHYLHILLLSINCDVCCNTHLKPLCLVKRTGPSLSLFTMSKYFSMLSGLWIHYKIDCSMLSLPYVQYVKHCSLLSLLWSLSASTAQCCRFQIFTVCKHCSMLSLPDIHCMQALLNPVTFLYPPYASTAQYCHIYVYNVQALLLLVTICNIQIYLKCHIPVITFILIFKFTDELIDYIDWWGFRFHQPALIEYNYNIEHTLLTCYMTHSNISWLRLK